MSAELQNCLDSFEAETLFGWKVLFVNKIKNYIHIVESAMSVKISKYHTQIEKRLENFFVLYKKFYFGDENLVGIF